MSAIRNRPLRLLPGDFMSREEFLRRWEAMPGLKFAELIDGVVYMPSPLGLDHGRHDAIMITWLGVYASETPPADPAVNATWLMLDSAPQPDASLRLLPVYGGRSSLDGKLASGVPEFVVETCVSSTSYDLHQKLDLYRRAGVPEYLAVLVEEREIRWHLLEGTEYRLMDAPADGIWKSRIWPGLWLDAAALLDGNLARVIEVVRRGTGSPELAEFLARTRPVG